MLAENCLRQLRGWADSLQNSDINGPRHLNEKTRKDARQKKRSEDFQRTLPRHPRAWHPKPKEAEEKGLILGSAALCRGKATGRGLSLRGAWSGPRV